MADLNDVRVREMTVEDYDAVVAVWIEAGLPYRPKGRDSRERVAQDIFRRQGAFLVAVAGDEVIGTAFGTTDGRKGWLNRLAVLPAWQGIGIGESLVKELEARFEKMGLEVFSCLIMKDNLSSQEFFSALGYEHHDDVQYYSKRLTKDA